MMLDDRTTALLRALLYPVQFESTPEEGIERVVKLVVMRNALQATATDYRRAIDFALGSNEKLSSIIPQDHDEATTRHYLKNLAVRLGQVTVPIFAR
jgi:hypothetical protein